MAYTEILLICLAFTALCAAQEDVRDEGAIIVYSHRLIRPNSDYEIIAQSFQREFDADVDAVITTPTGSVRSPTVLLGKGDQKRLKLKIPSLPATGAVKLNVTVTYKNADKNADSDGHQTIKSSEKNLQPMPSDDIILIQLDKPMYKAADAVRFRALILDQNLRLSASVKTITAVLKDMNGESVETKPDISYANANSPGYFEGTFQPLPFEPEYGNWSVEIVTKNQSASKTLQVTNYRLPRFAIYFNTPEWITKDDPTLPLSVTVRDQTGNPVVGSVDIVIKDPSTSEDKVLPTQATEMTSASQTHSYKLNHPALQKKFCQENKDGYITVVASAKERLTNKIEKAEKRIPYHCAPFAITMGSPSDTFRAGLVTSITIRIANHNGTPHPAALRAADFTATEVALIDHGLVEKTLEITDKKVDVEKGVVLLQLRCSSQTEKLLITVKVKDVTKVVDVPRRPSNTVGAAHIRVFGTKKYRVGDYVQFMLECNQDCKTMYYAVVSGKGVAIATSAKMTDEQSGRLNFQVTADMAPSSTIIGYYSGSQGVATDSAEITVEQTSLVQDISLNVGPEDKRQDYVVPGLGKKAKIEVTAAPNSLVGLLAVDKNLLQLASGHDLSAEEVVEKLLRTAPQVPDENPSDVEEIQAGNLVVSVFEVDGFMQNSAPEGRPASAEPLLRKDFRDSFMFITKQTDKTGKLSHLETVPDSITTWAVTAFAVSTQQPIGLTTKPSDLRVYQELYIHMDTPHSMIENETNIVNITLFNFRAQSSAATTLGFRYIVKTSQPRDKAFNADLQIKQRNAFQYFPIPLGPFKKGVVTVTTEVFEQGGGVVDRIQKKIQILQPGAPVFKISDVITLSSETPTVTIPVDKSIIPANVVPNSIGVKLTIFGDMWAPAVNQLTLPDMSREFEGLIRIPTGCGEQTMAILMPNVFLARYLRKLGGSALGTNNREKRLKENMHKGFQRQSSFRLKDGSYNTFGRKEQPGSTWLTAYVVRGMTLAGEFVRVDRNQIEKSLAFLDTKQNADGSFREDGSIIDRPLAGASAVGKGDILTAFVLLAYLENGRTTDVTNKARQYLERNFDKSTDPFALGLTCYVFSRSGSARTQECIAKMNNMAKEPSQGKRCWLDKKSPKGHDQQFTAKDVETTSYALLALCNSSFTGNLTPVVDWLLSQRNGHGGFKSTQDTIVALNALSELKTGGSSQKLNLEVVGVKGGKYTVSQDSLAPKSYDLPLTTDNVVIRVAGSGVARCQVEYKFQERMKTKSLPTDTPTKPTTTTTPKPTGPPVSTFEFNFTLRSNDAENNILTIELCPTYIGNVESGMVMIQIDALTGYEFNQEDVAALKDQTDVDNAVCSSKCELYIRKIDSGKEICLSLNLVRHSTTEDPAPRPVTVYRMYEPNVKKLLEYSLKDIKE
ncbi:CD109 antigen-like [Paramacrobiotus metropolitanus]|uniref:CD109 antigen-like n=1 Tax=Paramacrobiotus metropolitanus TaxID=2943436 RepID=UPI00244587FA|nr:CD109 antigen-like [Paramacrobiotus metropolitanus]